MATKAKLIKVGRQGVVAQRTRIPASFFRHQQPGKRFVVLAKEERALMHVRASDVGAIRKAYRKYMVTKAARGRGRGAT